MPIAQGINKTIAYKKQTGLGSVASGSGGQLIRRETGTFNVTKDTYAANEIVSHQQDTGAVHGIAKSSAQINGLLSGGSYADFVDSLLRKARAATTAISSLTLTIAASGNNYTITRAAGSFLTDGIKIGDVIQLSGGTLNAANINKNLVVLDVQALVVTVNVLNPSAAALVAQSAIASCTMTVPGKKTWVPTSGHTNDYYTFEEWFGDLSRSAVYPDMQIGMMDVSVPATGNVSANFGMVGLGAVTKSGTQSLTSPTAATTSSVMPSVTGAIYIGGVRYGTVTSVSLKVDGQVQQGEAVVGSNTIADVYRGRIKVGGSFTALYDSDTLSTPFDQASATNMVLVIADSATDNANVVTFVMPRIKLFSNDADDGEKQIIRTYNFTAEINGAGGPSLASHQTILSIQDSLAS